MAAGMRVRFDANEAAESIPRPVRQSVLIEKVARCVRTGVILQGARVEFLRFIPDRDREHVAVRALASKTTQAFKARIFSAKAQMKIQGSGVARDRSGVDLDA